MKNRLISDERRQDVLNCTGWVMDEYRASGRTLARAFSIIGEAMSYPGKHVPIRDHVDNKHQHYTLARLIRSILDTHQLKHFVVERYAPLGPEYWVLEYQVFG